MRLNEVMIDGDDDNEEKGKGGGGGRAEGGVKLMQIYYPQKGASSENTSEYVLGPNPTLHPFLS